MMETKLNHLLILLVVQLVSLKVWLCDGCWEQERSALLQIRSLVNNRSVDAPEGWTKGNSDCCQWSGVECNTTTRRVTKLSFSGITSVAAVDGYRLYLNASYLLPFEDLEIFTLECNCLAGFVIHEEMHNLSKLEVLILDGNPLETLQSLGKFSSLKFLSLSAGLSNWNTFPVEGICDLKKLEELDVSGNELQGTIPSCLRNMTSLKLLDLSNNFFTGNIALSPLPHLTSLAYLSILKNSFQVPVSFQSFLNNSNLKVIRSDENELVSETASFQTSPPKLQLLVFTLTNCRLGGLSVTIPSFLYHQYDLRVIDLSYTNFGGNFPSWLLENNTRIESVHLRNNSFTGSFRLPSDPNPETRMIDLRNNNLQGHIPADINLTFPNLRILTLAFNCLAGKIPNSLMYMTNLSFLDLSHNQLCGEIPQIIATDIKLFGKYVKLSYNNLGGQISSSFSNATDLGFLYLDGNNFVGNLPDISSNNYLSILDASNNNFSGGLPRWIGNMSGLTGIDLSYNQFEGSIPLEFSKLLQLEFLYLSENYLSGPMPTCLSLPSLSKVNLYKNRIGGPMRNVFNGSSSLATLDLSHNDLTGSIPSWLGNLSALSILLLRANHFHGDIPIQLCRIEELALLDLSHNNLSGYVPSCLSNLTFERSFISWSFWGIYLPTWYSNAFKRFMYIEKKFVIFSKSIDFMYLRFEESYSSRNKSFSTYEEIHSDLMYLRFEESDSARKGYGAMILDTHPVLDLEHFILVPEEIKRFMHIQKSHTISGSLEYVYSEVDVPHMVNFVTKKMSLMYSGLPLDLMSGIDLSFNQFTGEIPPELGNLTKIHALNLSYNNFIGSIPSTFANLKQIESLDLSYNNLVGRIPFQLIELNSLAVFSVANNNLSGAIPAFKRQFGTFEESSYEGNPLLCGSPLNRSCSNTKQSSQYPSDKSKDGGFIDMEAFYVSFSVAYTTVVLGIIAVLCINPRWRWTWFYFIEWCITLCYIFDRRIVRN